MEDNLFPILRNLTIFFATVMLAKYYVFLMLSPFHSLQETNRKIKLAKIRRLKDYKPYHPKVSVIIPSWNEEVGIIKTVQSVLNNDYHRIEIIIVNDGSTDRSDEFISSFLKKFKDSRGEVSIKYLAKENGGKGTALNHGIKEASGEIILTIDADSVLDQKAITKLVPYFEDKKIDMAVGQVRIAKSQSLLGLLQELEYIFGFYYKRTHSVLGAEYIFGGACAAFRKKEVFGQLGLFDIATKTEDIEMSLRTRYHGLHCVYAEDVICYTEGASTIKGLANQRLRWKKGRFDTFIKYRRLFFSWDKKHNTALSWFILPYALLSEFQLLFEPIGITLLVAYSIISGDYLSLAIGVLFIFLIYLVTAFFNHDSVNLRRILIFPLTWPLFYILVWIEYMALLKSVGMIVRGDDVSWQNWNRKGINI